MSAFGMHPTFVDYAGYQDWRRQWASLFRAQVRRISNARADLKMHQRVGRDVDLIAKMQTRLNEHRIMGAKLMTLLDTAKQHWARIGEMKRQIVEQNRQFPLALENCPSVDFHFNKGSIAFPFLPAWIVKTKGRSYYVTHVDFDCLGTTRETPEHSSTKGMIRFRHVDLHLLQDGTAAIRRKRAAAA